IFWKARTRVGRTRHHVGKCHEPAASVFFEGDPQHLACVSAVSPTQLIDLIGKCDLHPHPGVVHHLDPLGLLPGHVTGLALHDRLKQRSHAIGYALRVLETEEELPGMKVIVDPKTSSEKHRLVDQWKVGSSSQHRHEMASNASRENGASE